MPITEPVILYIDDDLHSLKVIQVLLVEVMGLSHVFCFETSENWVQRLLNLSPQPNLFLLDIQIKPLDGYAMLKQLRDIDEFQDKPVIALTANVMAHDINRLKAVGFNGLIGKPILDDIFPTLIERILNDESVWFVP